MRHKGIASNVIVIGSGVGVNAAVKTKQRKTAVRQGFRIDCQIIIPANLKPRETVVEQKQYQR